MSAVFTLNVTVKSFDGGGVVVQPLQEFQQTVASGRVSTNLGKSISLYPRSLGTRRTWSQAFLVVPTIYSELVFNRAGSYWKGYCPNTVTVRIVHSITVTTPSS